MRGVVVLLMLGILLFVSLGPLASADSPQVEQENRREYLIGGSQSGVWRICTPQLHLDLGAACDIPCPGGTCDITVIDDHKGTNIGFRVCFDGEEFCRPDRFWGTASVAGTRVTVAPSTTQATHGVVIVR